MVWGCLGVFGGVWLGSGLDFGQLDGSKVHKMIQKNLREFEIHVHLISSYFILFQLFLFSSYCYFESCILPRHFLGHISNTSVPGNAPARDHLVSLGAARVA